MSNSKSENMFNLLFGENEVYKNKNRKSKKAIKRNAINRIENVNKYGLKKHDIKYSNSYMGSKSFSTEGQKLETFFKF